MRSLILLWFNCCMGMVSLLQAQTILWESQLLNEAGQALPYASIRIEDSQYGAISNAEGAFSIQIPIEVWERGGFIRISCLGYQTKRISLADIQQYQQKPINLTRQSYELETVYIFATELSARQMLRKAIAKLRQTAPAQPYLLKSFYRHYCMEDGQYGRLIEAAMDIYHPQGHKKLFKSPDKKVQIRLNQLRRSFDFTAFSSHRHLPIAIYNSLQSDISSYKGPVSKNLDNPAWTFRYSDTTFYEDQIVYVIQAEGRTKGRLYRGEIFLIPTQMAILKVDESFQWFFSRKDQRIYQKAHHVCSYQAYEGRYYLHHVLHEGLLREERLDAQGNSLQKNEHSHHVEIMTNEIQTQNIVAFEGREPNEVALQKVAYDPDFWKHYTVLEATPLEDKIRQDLSEGFSLDRQYRAAQEGIPASILDQMAQKQFDVLLQKNRGNWMLVGFWNSEFQPGLKDILAARKLAKSFQDQAMSLILISTDREAESWEKQIHKKKLYGATHLRLANGLKAPLAQKYAVQRIPTFMLFNPEGRLVLNGTELPPKKELESLFQP